MKPSQRTIVAKHIWDKMSPADQKLYQVGCQTEEDREKWHQGREKEMHDQFSSWLDRNGFLKKYIHPRMDKKTGIGKGVFDFTIWKAGRVCFVEFKTNKGRLSEDQTVFLAAQLFDRTPVLVAHSYEDAVAFVENVFAV